MTVAANPLCQLAPGTRSPSCVYSIRLRFSATIKRLAASRKIKDRLCNCSAVFSTRGDGERSQEYPLNKETAFNLHNPSLDHRVR